MKTDDMKRLRAAEPPVDDAVLSRVCEGAWSEWQRERARARRSSAWRIAPWLLLPAAAAGAWLWVSREPVPLGRAAVEVPAETPTETPAETIEELDEPALHVVLRAAEDAMDDELFLQADEAIAPEEMLIDLDEEALRVLKRRLAVEIGRKS